MPTRHRLCRVEEIPPGAGREFVVADRIVAVFNVEGAFYALDGICPHAGGPLAEGKLEGCVVTCPWHGWQFDVTTGEHQLTPRIRQTGMTASVDGDDLVIDLP